MSQNETIRPLRTLPKDLGVALVTLLALAAGLLLFVRTDGRMRQFQAEGAPFRIAYPVSWIGSGALQDVLLRVVDPQTDSTFKTALTVESRELDPQNPPTVQTLLDRRVEQRGQLAGYHFLSDGDATVGGARAMQSEYAYVVQPIDQARRATLPVVVHAREYIVVTKERAYYITLAAPESEFDRASAVFDRIIATVQVQ